MGLFFGFAALPLRIGFARTGTAVALRTFGAFGTAAFLLVRTEGAAGCRRTAVAGVARLATAFTMLGLAGLVQCFAALAELLVLAVEYLVLAELAVQAAVLQGDARAGLQADLVEALVIIWYRPSRSVLEMRSP